MNTMEKIPQTRSAFTFASAIGCMRPRQWTKNLLLFAGLVFTAKFTEPVATLRVVAGFAIFCCLSGVVYIFNDLRDIEQDRLHPVKCGRPIACGAISASAAALWAGIVGLASILSSFALGVPFALAAIAYFVLNLLYSLWLKHVVIVDVFSIALGFVLRALAGVEIIVTLDPAVDISDWFLMCAFFLALFLAICKRRHESLLVHNALNGVSTRKVINEYSPALLDQMVAITTTSTVLTYALWAAVGQFADAGMLYTLPFVVFGIFRYLYLVYKRKAGGEPETVLLTDWPMIVCIALWLGAVMAIVFRTGGA